MIQTAILGGREAARLEDRQSALFFSIAATLTVQFARWKRPYSQVPPCSRKDWHNIATHFVLLWLSARFQARPPDLKTNYPNQVQTDCWQTERCTIRLIQSRTDKLKARPTGCTDILTVTCGGGDLNNFQLRARGLVQDTNLDVCSVGLPNLSNQRNGCHGDSEADEGQATPKNSSGVCGCTLTRKGKVLHWTITFHTKQLEMCSNE